ncbi:hypothetical protein RHSIM_Rhsim12G0132100 [Rhododendron simsii]|uniref:NAC domain-containing protein n=1 Tax=Rhododendron simsii TaxID=118357 RepID=A0A834LA05_RHOSS|nr:hypothetical protein RHSIM_Rhsim12G0132100 [Rhododendron simsii]
MEERSETEKIMDELMLPGFRFHPTDEELVGFYLKRKAQQRPLSIELIKQLDIYKYDPWDLPKLATTGEKEWYFYCRRDRKYRNSTRPNRVTGAGFWKATGTDRPIYSSEGSKCIGLKKSLVFYKGRAAKGIKTDWMMHEFRLPPLNDEYSMPQKRYVEKTISENDSWAICRIFKKTNSAALQRVISHSWVSPLAETATSQETLSQAEHLSYQKRETLSQGPHYSFTSEDTSVTVNSSSSAIQYFNSESDLQQSCLTSSSPSFLLTHHTTSKTSPQFSISNESLPASYPFWSIDGNSYSMFGDFFGKASENIDFSNGFPLALPEEMHAIGIHGDQETELMLKNSDGPNFDDQWGITRSTIGIPFSFPNAGRKPDLVWDSSPCPSDQMSTSYSTNKCYT